MFARILRDETQVPVELDHAPSGTAGRGPHVGHEKAAARQRQEVVGDARVGRPGREQELRVSRIGDVEEEDAVLVLEHAQQTAAREDLLVDATCGSGVARCRCCREAEPAPCEGPCRSPRLSIEVDDREEVGRDARLVARPHVQRRRLAVMVRRGCRIPSSRSSSAAVRRVARLATRRRSSAQRHVPIATPNTAIGMSLPADAFA